jgi:DNA-binding transcriptional ArsR family regulator
MVQKMKMKKTESPKSFKAGDKKSKAVPLEEHKKRLSLLSKGMAHPARVEIVKLLAHKPPDCRCMCGKIVEALPLAQSSVSQHLKILKETGWITAEPRGTSMCYCLADGIIDIFKNLLDEVIIYN